LNDRFAIVTGAASGIGAATARLLAENHAQVVAVDLPGTWSDESRISAEVLHLEHDVTEADAPRQIVESTIDSFGALDILVNNAGVGGRQFIADMTDDFWRHVLEVNTTAPFRLTKAALPHLRKSGKGRIINITSVETEDADYGLGAYCASKSGLAGLTRATALEEGRYGITANCIEPGPVRTAITERFYSQEGVEQLWASRTTLKRIAETTDIAKAILFLASDLSGYVTGQSLRVDGGLMLHPECSAIEDTR
jgi:NAD(P)-dependent dehydrogenase (short-subunit alcohol dehydrogenase family)